MNSASIKTSIMCIYFILKKYSDENHILSASRIMDLLMSEYDITMDRRAVYRNIQSLQSIGIDIGMYKDNGEGYYLISRDFDVFDIRLLCDAIASSEMLSTKDSKAIIRKLIGTLSIYDGRMLEKTIYIKNDTRISGYKIFYNIDTLLIAITQGVKVSIRLLKTGYDNEQILSDEGMIISPYATVWAEGRYYVLGKEEITDSLQHYRIDRIGEIEILERSADLLYGGLNVQEYAKRQIVDRGQNPVSAIIEVPEKFWEELTDTFEKVSVMDHKENILKIKVTDIRENIMKWVMQNLESCSILQPEDMKDEVKWIVLRKYREFYR